MRAGKRKNIKQSESR